MALYRCERCERDHDLLEPGFRRPDAFFAVPTDQRGQRARESDDLVSIDDAAFFLRGVVRLPVAGQALDYGWGFWARVAQEHFREYRRLLDLDAPEGHPGFPGTLANQTQLLAPTLGVGVHLRLGGRNDRPRVTVLAPHHPLAQMQREGLSRVEVMRLASRTIHAEEPEPHSPPVTPTLTAHGWEIVAPDAVNRSAHAFGARPNVGDEVKAAFRFLAANERGDVTARLEFMWVLLDDVQDDALWSGTLDNRPTVPAPIGLGSRVWLSRRDVIAHTAA